jgi:hypothetical protein
MQANVYTRERKHIGSIWSRVTCLALTLAAAKIIEHQALRDSHSLWRLMKATQNRQVQTNKILYIKQFLITKQTIPTNATHRYEHVGTRIT